MLIRVLALFLLAAVAVAEPGPDPNPDVTFHAEPKPLAAGAVTSDWTSFLGPTHDMRSPETGLMKGFPAEGPALVWEMNKGEGYAAPAVAGGILILYHRIENEAVVDCLAAGDGRRYWRFSSPTAYKDRYGYSRGPRCSPVVAGNAVITFGADGRLDCLDLVSGTVRWHHDILAEFALKQNFFGVGATPLVEGGKVIVNVGAPDAGVVAFDLATGERLWSAGKEWGPSYASPVPATRKGKRRVFVFAGGESDPPTGGLLCIDPVNGMLDYTFPWRGKSHESVNASSPVVIEGAALVSECYGSGSALVLDGTALWTNKDFGTHFMTAVVKDGYIYGVDGHGPGNAYLCCVEWKTGKEMWRAKPAWKESVATKDGPRELDVGTARCSLMLVDGRCLALGEYGHLLWLDLNPEGYRELARTWLFAARDSWTPPVLSHGLLYVCQNQRDGFHDQPPRLLCYDLRASAQ